MHPRYGAEIARLQCSQRHLGNHVHKAVDGGKSSLQWPCRGGNFFFIYRFKRGIKIAAGFHFN